MISGGPEKPACSRMTLADMMAAMEKYQNECKAYTYYQCCLQLKESEDFVYASIVYTGCIVKTLHIMVGVVADRLQSIS